MLGKVLYSESLRGEGYCNSDDYEIDEKKKPKGDTNLMTIVVVRRGQCSFAEKVKVAEEYVIGVLVLQRRLKWRKSMLVFFLFFISPTEVSYMVINCDPQSSDPFHFQIKRRRCCNYR